MLTLFFYLPAPSIPTVLWIISPLPLGLFPFDPSSFHPSTTLLSIFAPSSSLPSCPVTERTSTWTVPTPAGLHRSSMLPSHMVSQRSSSREPCPTYPVHFPPLMYSTCAQVPAGYMFLPSGGPLLSLPVSITLIPAPTPCRPRPEAQSPFGP